MRRILSFFACLTGQNDAFRQLAKVMLQKKEERPQKLRRTKAPFERAQKNGMRIAECTEKRIPFAIFAYCLSVVTEEEDKSSNSFCARILLRIAFITLSISLPSV